MTPAQLVGIEGFDPISNERDFDYFKKWIKVHHPEMDIDCRKLLDNNYIVGVKTLVFASAKDPDLKVAYCLAVTTFLEKVND